MLDLVHIAKIYGVKRIFKNISCHFSAGSCSLLMGANGAGKSTLLRIMAGLCEPSAGQVSKATSARLGYLGHATFIYPGLSAWENLAFWTSALGLRRSTEAISAVLTRVGLADHAQERAGIFSRGMAQRLNLARVLLQEPDILLLDEPDTGLDRASQALLLDEIAEARQRGACIVCITHDLRKYATLADRLLILESGRLAFDGHPTASPLKLANETSTAFGETPSCSV